jgi:hypothetical protein
MYVYVFKATNLNGNRLLLSTGKFTVIEIFASGNNAQKGSLAKLLDTIIRSGEI